MLGQSVTLARDGAEGVAAAASGSFDLILMDMQMPVMDGIAAARAIRATGDPTPIIAMTANASDRDRQSCLEAGMDGFEPKPITLERLSAIIRRSGETGAPPRRSAPMADRTSQPDAAIDRQRRDELALALGEDGLRDLTQMFFVDLPALLDDVDNAIARSDLAEFDHALHALKGAAANLGFASLADVAQRCRSAAITPEAARRVRDEAARLDTTLNVTAA